MGVLLVCVYFSVGHIQEAINSYFRLTQHYELGTYVEHTIPSIVLGDFNTLETEICTTLFKELSCLTDR